MLAYIIRRLLLGIPTILGVLFIIFVLFFWLSKPEHMALRALGNKASQEQVNQWIKDHGYGWPKFFNSNQSGAKKFTQTRIFRHYKGMITFDFGRADLDDILIIQKIKSGMGPSLTLALPTFALSLFFSISFSLLITLFRGTYIDKATVVLCVLGMSIVAFLYIIGGQFIFGKVLRWFPISGWLKEHMFHFLALPVVVGVVWGLGASVRFFRTVMVNEVNSDYIRTAKAKGLSDSAIMFKHLLKNAMIPILTQVVMEIPFLFTGSLLMESFFGIPGLGRLTVEAIQNNDFRTVSSMVYIGSLLYILGNLMTDISYAFVDPRVQLK